MKNKSIFWRAGLTVFVTTAAILLFYDTLFGSRTLVRFVRELVQILRPVIYGAMMAYLLAPAIDFWERNFFRREVEKARERGKMCATVPRAVSLLLTWALIGVGIWVLLPELYRSIVQLISNVETYYNTISGWVRHLLETNPTLEAWAMEQMRGFYQDFNTWLREGMLPQAQTLMTAVTGGIWQVLVFMSDLVVGVIVSVYLMATKERSAAHARKVLHAFLPQESLKWIFRGIHKADFIFSGFVRGKLLDSLIIGILCFVGCSRLTIPYTPLVAVFVGVTNVIPFFGPFLGAVPSTILILLDSPLRAVYFVLFILFLQQLDGNIIGPKILGDKTGISSLWVIIAILVGGGFFGFVGMFFGVPVFACMYNFVAFMTRRSLEKRGMPEDSGLYLQDFPEPEKREEP